MINVTEMQHHHQSKEALTPAHRGGGSDPCVMRATAFFSSKCVCVFECVCGCFE